MGTDTYPHVLDLDSQIQLLSRIQFITRFSSNLIQITGDEGAGKTWLSQRYLEQWTSSGLQALLLCHPNQSDSQHRAFILQQLAPRSVFNEQDPILQSIERVLGAYSNDALIVIDDAHLLSPVLLAELWALVQHARSTSGWQINVLLFNHTGRLDKYLRQVTHGQGAALLELEISPLTAQEAQAFLEMRTMDKPLDAPARRWLREQATSCAPLPGALVKLESGENKDMAEHTSRRSASMMVLLILVMLVIGSTIWWFMPSSSHQPSLEPTKPLTLDETALPDTQALVEQASSDVVLVGDNLIEGEGAITTEMAQDDSHRLPPEVSLEGLTVGRSDDNPRVVVPSTVVDAMINEQELGGTGEVAVAEQQSDHAPAISEDQFEPAPDVVVESSLTTPATAQEASDAVEVELSTVPERQPASEPAVELGASLREISSQHYALQLAALKSLTAADAFIERYQLATVATVYQTRRNGEPWFIIVTGDYPDVQAARQAELSFPETLQVLQPWAKSYLQIHREMDLAK